MTKEQAEVFFKTHGQHVLDVRFGRARSEITVEDLYQAIFARLVNAPLTAFEESAAARKEREAK
jgi:DNA-directed RNA polymerase specialized sigma24 family protein